MFKYTINYKDLDNEDVTEDLYFNLSKADIAKIELSAGPEGLEGKIKRLMASTDRAEIISIFEWILELTYGKRDPRNLKLFIKGDEVYREFRYSGAYDAFFIELLTSEELASRFILEAIPQDMRPAVETKINEQPAIQTTPELPEELENDDEVEDIETLESMLEAQMQALEEEEAYVPPTKAELQRMSKPELREAMKKLQQYKASQQ